MPVQKRNLETYWRHHVLLDGFKIRLVLPQSDIIPQSFRPFLRKLRNFYACIYLQCKNKNNLKKENKSLRGPSTFKIFFPPWTYNEKMFYIFISTDTYRLPECLIYRRCFASYIWTNHQFPFELNFWDKEYILLYYKTMMYSDGILGSKIPREFTKGFVSKFEIYWQ